MTATTKQANNGEYYGIVIMNNKEVYSTMTTSLDRIDALIRARKWIREQQEAKIQRAEKTAKRVRKHYRKKAADIAPDLPVVSTPKGAGILIRKSSYIAEVKINGVIQCFLPKDVTEL